jgi:hypothetical protein
MVHDIHSLGFDEWTIVRSLGRNDELWRHLTLHAMADALQHCQFVLRSCGLAQVTETFRRSERNAHFGLRRRRSRWRFGRE